MDRWREYRKTGKELRSNGVASKTILEGFGEALHQEIGINPRNYRARIGGLGILVVDGRPGQSRRVIAKVQGKRAGLVDTGYFGSLVALGMCFSLQQGRSTVRCPSRGTAPMPIGHISSPQRLPFLSRASNGTFICRRLWTERTSGTLRSFSRYRS